jgi:hypothetical protein
MAYLAGATERAMQISAAASARLIVSASALAWLALAGAMFSLL